MGELEAELECREKLRNDLILAKIPTYIRGLTVYVTSERWKG